MLNAGPQISYRLPFSLTSVSQLHPYAYVSNNPINLADPSGLFHSFEFLAECAYNEYLNGKNSITSSNDKYKHCVISCKMGRKCGQTITLLVGIIKEIIDLLDLDPRSSAEFEDILADTDGLSCCSSPSTCEKCCECEKGHEP